MSFNHGKVAAVYLAGFNATTVSNEVSESGEVDTADITVFGNNDKSYISGMNDAKVTLQGFFDQDTTTDANTFNYLINSLLGQNRVQMTWLPAGDSTVTSGTTVCYICTGPIGSYEVSTPMGNAASFKLGIQSANGLERGVVLHGLQARTATGNGTQIWDNGASSTNGGSAVLHVQTVSGTSTPTLTVKVQGSPDGVGTWADLGTFTAVTAKGSQYVTWTGATQRYLRAIWTISGSSPSFTFFVGASRK